jgi:hypothetical protein
VYEVRCVVDEEVKEEVNYEFSRAADTSTRVA